MTSGGPFERTVVTRAPPWRRMAAGAVLLPLVLALVAALSYSRFAYDCRRADSTEPFLCTIDVRDGLHHDAGEIALVAPLFTEFDRGSDESSRTELLIEDDTTGARLSVTSSPGTIAWGRSGLASCVASARLTCAAANDGAMDALRLWASMSVLLVLAIVLLSLGRTSLVADRARREVRVVRRHGPIAFRGKSFAAERAIDIDVTERSGESTVWVVELLVDGRERVALGTHPSAAAAAAAAHDARALIAWLRESVPAASVPDPSATRAGWMAATKTLRTGVLMTQLNGPSVVRQQIVALLLGMGGLAVGVVTAVRWDLSIAILVGPLVPLLIAGIVQRKRARRAGPPEPLVVERDGVSVPASGVRRLVRWGEIASVSPAAGRYVFANDAGEPLFSIRIRGQDDVALAETLAAAARTGEVGDEGVATRLPIPASGGWRLMALLGAAALLVFGVVILIADDTPPSLDALEHRTGTVVAMDVSRGNSVQFRLRDDPFAFYVVRGIEHARAVRTGVHEGDTVEIWHDRSDRSFGPIGAIFELRAGGRTLVDREADAARVAQTAATTRRISAAVCALGLVLLVVAATRRSRTKVQISLGRVAR